MFTGLLTNKLHFLSLAFISGLLLLGSCKPRTSEENTIQQDPANASLLFQRSKMLMNLREFEKSLTDIQKALSIDSSKAEYYILLADLNFTANKTHLAKEALERALTLDPANADANMKLAEIYFYVKQYDQSIAYIDGVLKSDLHHAKAYFLKGMNFKEKGDTAKAISSFQTTIEQNQNYYAAYMQLAILMHARNNPLAVQYYDAAIRLDPKSEEAFYGRGLYFQDHGELDKAIQDYTTLSQINPKNKQAFFNLGYLHYTYLKLYDQAIKHYTQAIACDPYYAEAYFNRGLTYEALGNIGAAKQDYEKALKIRPGYSLAASGLKRVQ